MIHLRRLAPIIGLALLAACAPRVEDDLVLAEPVIEEPSYEAPAAKRPTEEACTSGDGIGGTGCPSID